MEVLRWGYRVPFLSDPPLVAEPIPFPSYSPTSIRGKALEKEVQSLVEKGAVELAPLPSPGFYSRVFVVMKALGSWRPVIDLFTLNLRVRKTPFKMETLQSVLLSVRSGDWMVSIDLKDAYLQIPVHPDSRKYLRFVALNQVFQFKALCFGLSTAPQVFTWVMAPVSAFLHRLGIRMWRYLDDWLIQASSRPLVLQALETVIHLCQDLGIVINWEKSNLLPWQRVVYLGVILDSTLFRASPSQPRVEKLCLIVEEFLSCDVQPVSLWRKLLGVLSSLTAIVPGGRLRMRSLQLRLHRLWDQEDDSTLIPWDRDCRLDLEWWIVPGRFQSGISLAQINPHLDFWSDASDLGWGAHLLDATASGRWSQEEALLSINTRELLAVEYGLRQFHLLVSNSTVAVFADNLTALAYLRKRGHSISGPQLHCSEDPPLGGVDRFGSGSPVHPGQEQCSGGLPVSPKPSPGVRVDSEVGGLSGVEQQVAGDDRPFCHLVESPLFTIFRSFAIRRRSVRTLFFGTGTGIRCMPFHLGYDTAGSEEALIIFWGPHDSNCPILAPEAMVSGPPGISGRRSDLSTEVSRSPQPTALPLSSSRDGQAVPSCLETIQRFARSQGFSSRVVKQLVFACRSSSRAVYQSKWLVYRGWCRGAGHSISRPTLPKIALPFVAPSCQEAFCISDHELPLHVVSCIPF